MGANTGRNIKKHLHVIVLEDSLLLSEIVKFCILSWFWEAEVTVFENGDLAWAELSRQAPDLLITDRLHPGMKGEELLRRLAEKNVQYPILLLSGDLTAPANLPAKLNLVCLAKPFTQETLWLMLNELVGPCEVSVRGRGKERPYLPPLKPATPETPPERPQPPAEPV